MRWDYDSKWRDMFNDNGVHKDILIVPHATRVTKVSGSAPLIESKVPKFYKNDDPEPTHHIDDNVNKEGKRIPNEYEPVEWTITNDDIENEKFEFADGLCSNDKLTFGSCEAAMVKVTIRNNKTYNEESGRYELDIPNLQKIEVISEDGKKLYGEVQASAVVHVYVYFNGDSDSLIWLGMYKVEQDKIAGDGYFREIVMYDFMLTFRDMDIFEWYKALFEGTPIDSEDESKGYNQHRPKYDEWTIGEALKNLFDNLAYYSPGKCTITNPKDYLLDMDADNYPGFGMPILLDPDIFDYSLPAISVDSTTAFPFPHERYGGMRIMDFPFRADEKILKKGSLSCGKFLEDIASLAGRFGCIRKDIFKDDDYIEPDSTKIHRYNTYEKCYLTFRPLPNSEDANVENGKIQSENFFDDSEIEKGIQYELYDTKEVKIVEMYDYNKVKRFYYCPKGLKEQTKMEYKQGIRTDLNVFQISENMFTSYLTEKYEFASSFIKILKGEYTGTRTVPDYTASMARPVDQQTQEPEKKTIDYTGKALLRPGFDSMVNRPYRPYQLSTMADLCRMPGDIIEVKGTDKITGEEYHFTSFVLVRRVTGIQKMMDKYTAKGDSYAGSYSDYRSGELNDSFHPQSLGYGRVSSGSSEDSGDVTNISGITPYDLIEYLRNDGIRYLDEPSGVSAVYNATNKTCLLKWTDPVDIVDSKPHPAAWEGTVVVRKEDSAPYNPWDGTQVVNSSTRDQYKTNGFTDVGLVKGRIYYYGFFPYFTTLQDVGGIPLKRYTFTKIVKVNTEFIMTAPEIKNVIVDGIIVTVEYYIPQLDSGSYTTIKLVVKKNSAPQSKTDGTKIYDLSASGATQRITGLDENSIYYFAIFTEDSNDNDSQSDAVKAVTDICDEGFLVDLAKTLDKNHYKYVYDYTGNLNSLSTFSEFYKSDWILVVGNDRYNYLQYWDGNEGYGAQKTARTNCVICIPVPRILVSKVRFQYKFDSYGGHIDTDTINVGFMRVNDNNSLSSVFTGLNRRTNEWTWVDVTLDEPFYADYVCISVCDSLYHFKDIEMYK